MDEKKQIILEDELDDKPEAIHLSDLASLISVVKLHFKTVEPVLPGMVFKLF
ncbi:unnamed protein product [Gongylonema pulchrum]|uniref:Uncharacterized protein n=1 Tax=Gongylonema pulchrum TaxID=637853 RepID=A0A3P6SYT0_9BILA|nr:unnamed protein product [Gongylonema pulchrum]